MADGHARFTSVGDVAPTYWSKKGRLAAPFFSFATAELQAER